MLSQLLLINEQLRKVIANAFFNNYIDDDDDEYETVRCDKDIVFCFVLCFYL